MLKVRDLKPGMDHLDIQVEVAEVSEQKKVITSSGIKHDILELAIRDETAAIVLVLWDDKIIQNIKVGDKLQVTNGFVTSYQGEWRINVGKYGEIERVQRM